jgi:hypothetical protein
MDKPKAQMGGEQMKSLDSFDHIGSVLPFPAIFLLQSAATAELTNTAAHHILTLSIQNVSVEWMKLAGGLDRPAVWV